MQSSRLWSNNDEYLPAALREVHTFRKHLLLTSMYVLTTINKMKKLYFWKLIISHHITHTIRYTLYIRYIRCTTRSIANTMIVI